MQPVCQQVRISTASWTFSWETARLMSMQLIRTGLVRRMALTMASAGLVGTLACGGDGSAGPAAPSPTPAADDQLLALSVSCQPSLLVGESAPCIAVASYRSGRQPLVSFESAWSSSLPDVVSVDNLGVSTGKSPGQATVTAAYGGRRASSVTIVIAEDALRISSGQAQQGDFRPGATVTLWLQGYYSVASADTARLNLKITDESGVIATTAPLSVSRGGNSFVMSATFVVPDTSVEICRTAVLQVGPVTVAEPHSKDYPLWCVPVRR